LLKEKPQENAKYEEIKWKTNSTLSEQNPI